MLLFAHRTFNGGEEACLENAELTFTAVTAWVWLNGAEEAFLETAELTFTTVASLAARAGLALGGRDAGRERLAVST